MHEFASKLGDNDNAAVNTGTIATLVSTVEALQQDVLNQATAIAGLSSTIVQLENTVEEQSGEIIRNLNGPRAQRTVTGRHDPLHYSFEAGLNATVTEQGSAKTQTR